MTTEKQGVEQFQAVFKNPRTLQLVHLENQKRVTENTTYVLLT